MYKVFLNNKSIFIGQEKAMSLPSEHDYVIRFTGKNLLMHEIGKFNKSDLYENMHIIGNPSEIMKLFNTITAAGGLVQNSKKEILFIFRHGKWDLPKGKVEFYETIEDAAIREVEEECGVTGLSIINKLPPVYHSYILNHERVLKITHWYQMFCKKPGNTKPQWSEDITDVKWIKTEDIPKVLENTYLSIKETVLGFLDKKLF